MSYSRNSVFPKIVTDGLILYLDASNHRSYPGSGDTWYDLTKYRSNGTLVSSSFISANPSYVDINSIPTSADQQLGVIFNLPITSNVITIDLWARFTGFYGIALIFGFNNNYFVGFSPFQPLGSQLGWGSGGGDFRYLVNSTNLSGTGMPSFTDWYNLVFIMYTNTPHTNNKGYINGVEYSQGGSTGVTVSNFGNGDAALGSWGARGPGANYYPLRYDCNSFKVYNKALSISEIQQNYNALKYRFGL